MSLPPLHKTLEECAFRALPAPRTQVFDGWVVRLAGGGPKRANSVNVVDTSTLPLAHKIGHCEQLFLEQGLAPTFRLTWHEVDAGLDALLAARGYVRQDESIVMTLALDAIDTTDMASAACTLLAADEWLQLLPRIDQGTPERKRKHVELLRRLDLPALYGAVETSGEYHAMGLVVIDDDYAGLFDIATLPGFRRRGYARSLTRALLHGAKRQGAKSAYLQVVAGNSEAVTLYASLGFADCYRYWYRVRDTA
ncbi:MAG TPA: GNAT family N-acetyltransferase [Burkholderiaceae bacterium]